MQHLHACFTLSTFVLFCDTEEAFRIFNTTFPAVYGRENDPAILVTKALPSPIAPTFSCTHIMYRSGIMHGILCACMHVDLLHVGWNGCN